MTAEQRTAEAVVTIRTSPHDWVCFMVPGGVGLALAASALLFSLSSSFALRQLIFGCLWIAMGLSLRTFGVDLTPEYANLRGLRRRSVPWSSVQAVVQHRSMGTWCVRLILENGRPLTLRAPTAWGGFGGPGYERDFDRIGQWWLAHRGDSWRPLRPEAPQLTAQE